MLGFTQDIYLANSQLIRRVFTALSIESKLVPAKTTESIIEDLRRFCTFTCSSTNG